MPRRLLTLLPPLLLILSAPAARAGAFEVGVSNESFWLATDWKIASGKLDMGASWMHHEDNGDVGGLGLHMTGLRRTSPSEIRAGLGAKLFYLEGQTGADGWAIGLGGFTHYRLPGESGVGFGGRVYFAPDVAAFGDASKYVELEFHVSYAVFEGAELFLGYTFAEADFENALSADLDTGVLLGFRLAF